MNEDSQSYMAARIRAFDQRHGGRENSTLFGNWIYYRDGANRDILPEGLLQDVPADDYQRLRNVLNYFKGRLAEAVRAFDDLKQKLSFSASTDRGGLDQLKKLRDVVTQRNTEVQAAQEAFMNTPEAQAREGARRFAAEEQARRKVFEDELRAIRV